MYISDSKLRQTTEPQINKAKSNLDLAQNSLMQIIIPDNFSYSSELSKIQGRIEQIKKDVGDINSYIEAKIDEYNNADKKSMKLANSLLKGLSGITGALGKTIFGTPAQNANANPSSSWLPKNMLNNPDYEYYLQTQAGNITKDNKTIFPYSEAYMEKKYAKTMAEIRNKNLTLLANYTKDGLKSAASVGGIKAYASEILSNEKYFDVDNTVDLKNRLREDFGVDSIQGMAYDGENLVLAGSVRKTILDSKGNVILDSNGNKVKEDIGGKILKYNSETDELTEFMDLTNDFISKEEIGHFQVLAYNNVANAYVIRNYAKEKAAFEIDNKTKKVTEYKLPDTYRVLTYDEKNNKLIGLKQDDKIITFLTRNESKKEYDNPEEVPLKGEFEFKNIQNISCDENYIYLYQSGHKIEVPEEDWKTFVFDYDGKKVAEFKIREGLNHPELEGGCKDKDNNHWVAANFEIGRVNKSDFANTTMASNN